MTTQRKGATLVGLPDRFVAVEIETEAPPAFDAAQYSFFGDLSAADSGLEGALEDGLEAPPPEEGVSSQDYGYHAAEDEHLALDEEEDLSVASIFRNQLGLGPAKTPTKRVDPDDDAGLDALLTDPLSVARKQLQDDDYDHRELPLELYPEAVPTPVVSQPQALFGASPGTYQLFSDGYGSALGTQAPGAAGAPTAAGNSISLAVLPATSPQSALPPPQPSPPASNGGATLLQMLKKPQPPPMKAMTLEELEARMLSKVEAAASAPPGTASVAVLGGASVPAGAPEDGLSAAGAQQQQPPGFLTRPLPGMPVNNAGGRGVSMQGPRMPVASLGGPQPAQGAFPQQFPSHHPGGPTPGGPQGPPLHGTGMPPPHLHGATPLVGPMQVPMMLPGASGPGVPGMYPQPPMGHMVPGARPMYSGNGMMAHQHHHPSGAPMMQPGSLPPPHYGPSGMYPPRGPMPPMGMSGAPPFMHEGFPGRPMGAPPGVPGPVHGMPPRPGPFGYGHPSQLGPGPVLGQQQQGPQRPLMLAGPVPPPPAGASSRPGIVMGLGAAGPRPLQPRQAPGAQPGPDFGQQFSRISGAPSGASAAGPVALAAAAAAAGRAGGVISGPGGRLGGKWMRPEDIEYVVRSMLYTVANGVPYVEDYYYQAFVHKHVSQPSRQQLSPGAFPMAAPFVPESLRELSEDQMSLMRLDPSAKAKFVEGLQGLGKIVLSNIRTPKVLMDITDRALKGGVTRTQSVSSAGGEGSSDVAKGVDQRGSARPLEQEPLLAARIMIEDCMNLLLDVDDIDRLANHMAAMAQAQQRAAAVAAALPLPSGSAAAAAAAMGGQSAAGLYGPLSAAPPSRVQLSQRRELLLTGINGAFRLPNSPRGTVTSTGSMDGSSDMKAMALSGRVAGSLGDGVLVRILALSKGRGVVARALVAIAPPASLLGATGAPRANPQPAAGTVAPPAQVTPLQSPQQSAEVQMTESKYRGVDAPKDAPASQAETAAMSAAAATQGSQEDTPATVASSEEGAGSLFGADAASPYVLLWGVLRSAWMVFGSSLQQDLDAAIERPFLDATSRLAMALKEALLRLPTPRDVVDAAAAFNAGCRQHVDALCQGNAAMASSMESRLLPLAQTRTAEPPSGTAGTSGQLAPTAWLGDALAALVTRASQLGLSTSEAGEADEEAEDSAGGGDTATTKRGRESTRALDPLTMEWRHEYALLHERLSRHLTALGEIHSMAAASGNAEALAVVRALSCRLLVNAMMQHASAQQAQELKAALPVPAA